MKIRRPVFLLLVSLWCCAAAGDLVLVENGEPKCSVVVRSNASRAEAFGAAELAKYIEKATGAKVKVVVEGGAAAEAAAVRGGVRSAAASAAHSRKGVLIRISTVDANSNPQTLKHSNNLSEEGFLIDVRPDGLDIVGADGRGALYGCYEVLKRHFGMRWIAPGEDCEYCVLNSKAVSVPFGKTVKNPYLRVRRTLSGERETMLWQIRNNLQPFDSTRAFFKADGRTLSETGGFYESIAAGGVAVDGHMMSALLLDGMDPRLSAKQKGEKMLAEHPDWCPLVAGKRVATWDAHTPNPCVSTPALLDHMAANLVKTLRGRHTCEDYLVTIGNNDTTVWCQCEKCRALDPPETRGTRGELSDRYWYMVNELGKRVWKELPQAKIGGWAYQNFWFAPVRVRPDPRLSVLISYNNQCWRHSVCDESCAANRNFVNVYKSWKALNMPVVINRDEIGAWDGHGSPGCELLPSESVLAKSLREYPSLGCSGSNFCVNPPFPEFSGFAKTWSPFFGKRYHWWAMWQTCYVSALLMWDRDADWKAALEEANRLYYGAAWEKGMKRFRALLTDVFLSTPGCIGWGLGVTTGRCLDRPNSEKELISALDEAVAAAKASGDAAVVKRCEREREIFNLTWVKERRRYIKGYRAMSAYRRTGEIRVDGVLDESDWKGADTYSNFKQAPWGDLPEIQPTYVRITYDRDTLYFAVECMEPTPAKMMAGAKVDRSASDCANLGNHIELFYSYPDMNEASWQLMINSKGQIVDSYNRSPGDRDTTIVSKAKYAVKVLEDRWIVEAAIPCTEIGQNVFDGATWKVNVARQRYIEGRNDAKGNPVVESSTAANGLFHGTANFVNVKFIAKREGTGASDKASWQNGSFDELVTTASLHRYFRWGHCRSPQQPKFWDCSPTAITEIKKREGSDTDMYLHLENGEVNQYYLPTKKGKVKLTFKARGNGQVGLVMLNFVDKEGPNPGGYKILGKPAAQQPCFDLTPEWKMYSVVREANGFKTERISTRFHPRGEGSWLELDDVYFNPCE